MLLEVVSTGGSAPSILSLGARVVLHDGSSTAQPVFHSYVKVDVTASKAATRQVHGLGLADAQAEATGDFGVVARAWLDWLKQAVPAGEPCAVVSWGGFKGGHFSLLPLELARLGLKLPSNLTFFDVAALSMAMKQQVRAQWPAVEP